MGLDIYPCLLVGFPLKYSYEREETTVTRYDTFTGQPYEQKEYVHKIIPEIDLGVKYVTYLEELAKLTCFGLPIHYINGLVFVGVKMKRMGEQTENRFTYCWHDLENIQKALLALSGIVPKEIEIRIWNLPIVDY
jgi:hypothetical protein